MDSLDLKGASQCIKEDELVIFPTETVYGIGANALSAKAVSKIYEAKERPKDNPVIVHISDSDQLNKVISDISDIQEKLIKEFWPGPLTVIFEKSENIPDIVTAGANTVAVRMPSHGIAHELIDISGVPIAAPSANISGKVSPTHHEDIDEVLKDRVCQVLEAGRCDYGVESTVVKVEDNKVFILRPGAITKGDIKTKLGVDVEYSEEYKNNENKVMSPGVGFKHYSPDTKIVLVPVETYKKAVEDLLADDKSVGVIGTELMLDKIENKEGIEKISLGIDGDFEMNASKIFSALNRLDKLEVDIGVVHTFEERGIGRAIMDRLKRAVG